MQRLRTATTKFLALQTLQFNEGRMEGNRLIDEVNNNWKEYKHSNIYTDI